MRDQEMQQIIWRAEASLHRAVSTTLVDCTDGARRFFASVIDAEPFISTMAQLAQRAEIPVSTFCSRFDRADVATPKRTLALVRLTKVAALLSRLTCTVSDAAHVLRYSSPNALHRNVRWFCRQSMREFRAFEDAETMTRRFTAEVLTPYVASWRTFDPYMSGHYRDVLRLRDMARGRAA